MQGNALAARQVSRLASAGSDESSAAPANEATVEQVWEILQLFVLENLRLSVWEELGQLYGRLRTSSQLYERVA